MKHRRGVTHLGSPQAKNRTDFNAIFSPRAVRESTRTLRRFNGTGTRSPALISPNSSSHRLVGLMKANGGMSPVQGLNKDPAHMKNRISYNFNSPLVSPTQHKTLQRNTSASSHIRILKRKASTSKGLLSRNQSVEDLQANSARSLVASPRSSRQPSPKPALINMVKKCAYKSKTGSVEGKVKKNNQDTFIITPHFSGVRGQYIFGVNDGHGCIGHHVSAFLQEKLPYYITKHLPDKAEDNELVSDRLKLAFQETKYHLVSSSGIDCTFSGSTSWTVIIRGNQIITANVGDSRAVMGQRIGNNWFAKDLTEDQKPDNEGEKQRIEASGGRIEPFYDNGEPVGPYRVWIKEQNIPGLAMSRSFGDLVAASVGVISEPEVNFYNIENHDRFLIVASDGLWEFIQSQYAVEMVGNLLEKGKIDEACNRLVEESTMLWECNEGAVDDTTIVLVIIKKS